MVKKFKKANWINGRSKPGWGRKHADQFGGLKKLSSQSSQQPHLDNLISIMHLYINWNQQQHPQEVDITVDGSAHSPVIPIPVSSTPVSAFISDPPSSTPEVFASPICPPAPSSTHAVTTSISDPPFATPEGHIQPSLVFEDIVERKFGSESVYCGNMWQSVLQTCSELNQIQTSKMLHILGKLNEDNAWYFTDRGNALQWAASVSLSPNEVQEIKDKSIQEIVAKSVQSQVFNVNALQNFTDIELLQVTFAAGFLKKPRQQHCELSGAVWYNTKQSPPCCFQPDREEGPLHIIWLPLTGQGNTFNHICPLLPWKRDALDTFLCVFWQGFNTQHSSRHEMVQCLTCLECYHCVCLGISFEEAKDSTIGDVAARCPTHIGVTTYRCTQTKVAFYGFFRRHI